MNELNAKVQTEETVDEPIGFLLRGERLTMGLTLEDVHERLRIRPEVIDAIENNNLEAITHKEYLPGYIRSYACMLKMNPEEVLQAYEAQCGLKRVGAGGKNAKKNTRKSGYQFHAPQRSWGQRLQNVTRTTSLAFPLLVVFALLGGAVYMVANFFHGVQTLEFTPTETRPTALTQNTMPVVNEDDLATQNEFLKIDYEQLYERQALQTPVVTPRSGRIADVDINRVGFFADEAGAEDAPIVQTDIDARAEEGAQAGDVELVKAEVNATSTAQAPAQTPVQIPVQINEPVVTVGPTIPEIQLLPLGQSWVRLTNEDGEVLFEKLLQPGEVVNVPVEGYVPVLRRAGNASELYVRVNGEVFGPVGQDGVSVVNNVPLTPEAVKTGYDAVDDELNLKLHEKEQSYLAKAENYAANE